MRKREAHRGRVVGGVRAAVAVAVLAAGMAACGDDGERPASRVVEESGPDETTVALIESSNQVMAGSSFAASGTNSAFGGAEQEITWDPEHGFHMTVIADDGTETDMYCRDGRSYISAPLLAETLNQRGRQITVPEDIADRYVTVQAESCDAYFAVPDSAERAPKRDTTVDGAKTQAVVRDKAGSADVYHLAASGRPRLLKWDAERDGLKTTMTYGGFGEEYPVTLPSGERQMKMSAFQAEVVKGGTDR
jgi:hypothetical protein